MFRFGLIGWGYWGRNYAKYLNPSTGAIIEWVCDLEKEALLDAKKNTHI